MCLSTSSSLRAPRSAGGGLTACAATMAAAILVNGTLASRVRLLLQEWAVLLSIDNSLGDAAYRATRGMLFPGDL